MILDNKIKLFCAILFALCINSVSLAQSYDTIQIKENFDEFNDYVVYHKHKVCTISPNEDAFVFGDGMSKILEAYLDMYDATGDKAYLYKFAIQSLCVVENRNDINPESIAKTPKWTENTSSTYTDGYILAALSKFVFYIKIQYPELINEQLVGLSELNPNYYSANTCNCNYTNKEFLTFGEYAQWLEIRIVETLTYFFDKGMWSDSRGMLQPGSGLIINMQTGFARALLFTGLSSGNQEYVSKAEIIAGLHKSDVVFNDKCSKQKYSAPVFILDEEKNSYWWYHMGWRLTYRSCKRRLKSIPNYDYFTSYVEDINHGAIVLLFPYDYFKYSGDTIFNIEDMRRFRNTFTRNVFDGKKNNMAVDGSNGTTYNDTRYDSVTLSEIVRYSPIAYARWAEFDSLEVDVNVPSVYNLLMNSYYVDYAKLENVPSWYSGQKTLGHAMLIKEQWARENVSLIIGNRDLIYNQDFIVDGDLTISPQLNKTKINPKGIPYAEPKVFLDGGALDRFVVESNVEMNVEAGESVRIQQGFYAKKGSTVRIKVQK